MGGITGIFLAVFPVDWQLHDTYFVVAHFHYTAFGAAAFAMVAAATTGPEDDRPADVGVASGRSRSSSSSSGST